MAGKRILVVDDDQDIIISMKAILESKDYSVFTAGDENGCMEIFDRESPEIVFLDLMMESMESGINLCKKIREKSKDVRIYLLSAVGDEVAGTIDIHKTGFNGAMSKPVSPEELLNMVE